MRRLIDDGGRRVRPRPRSSRARSRRPAPRQTWNPVYRRSTWSGSSWVPPPKLDSPRIESILDEMFAAGTYERVVDDHVIPALRALGEAWAAGTLSVAGEHVASNAVQRRLAASFQASGAGHDQGRPVLVGMPPGAPRARRAHVRDGAASGRPSGGLPRGGCAIGRLDRGRRTDRRTGRRDRRSHACRFRPQRSRSRHSFRAARPEVIVAFGGVAAPDPGAADAASAGTIRLPADVGEAVTALEAALTTSASPRRGAGRGRSAAR